MNKKKKPLIRFKGFTDDWEQRKVLDLLDLLTDFDANGSFADMAKNVNTFDGNGFAWYVRMTDLDNPKPLDELKYVDKPSYDFLRKTHLHGGELLMAKRGNIGKIYIFEPRTEYATVAPNMYLLKLNTKVIPRFLYNFFLSDEGKRQLLRLNASTTMGALYKDDVKNIDVIIPPIEEQKKIAEYFAYLDNLITLHQRKCEKLKIIKKSMLENCFPKNGQKVPKIRFSGFTGDWEQRKLHEVADIIGGGTPSTNNSDYWDGDIDWYTPAEIGDKIFVSGSIRKITEEGLKNSSAKILPANKTVLFTSRAGIGNMAILQYAGATNQGFQSLICNADIDPYFIFSMKNMIQHEAERVAAGSTFAEISGKSLGKLSFLMPKWGEQRKLGNFFQQMDNLITLHQSKLEKLKKIKKSMLERMFV